MAIKITMLKSGEDIISDIHEVIVPDPEIEGKDRLIAYRLTKPYVVKLTEPAVLLEEEKPPVSVLYYPWAPLSVDKEFFIPLDWVVTHYTPHTDIINSYLEKRDGRRDDRHDGTTGGDSGEDNKVYLTEESLLVDNGDSGTEG